mgnify:CR=1 FL=1
MEINPSSLTDILCPLDRQCVDTGQPFPAKPFNYCICAKKGQGKSTLLCNLLMKKGSPLYEAFDLIFVISPTARGDDKMADLLEDIGDQYYDTLDNEVIKDILNRIEAHKEHLQSKKKTHEPHYCLVMDDCLHMMKGKHASMVSKLATTNRHLKLTNIWIVQKWNTYMSPLIRSNLDVISIFHTDNRAELESFVKEIGINEEVLMKLYEFATCEPYSFLHINMYRQPMRFYKRFDRIEYRTK